MLSKCFVILQMVAFGVAVQDPIQDVSTAWVKPAISVVPDVSQFSGPSKIMKAMARMPPPIHNVFEERVDPVGESDACDRDFSQLCPEHFVNIGPVKPGAKHFCAGSQDYSGPCEGAYSFEGFSPMSKAKWSEMCLTNWPCKLCTRNHRHICPQHWRSEGGGTSCIPTEEYLGPCAGTIDFASYNEEMRDVWSHDCEVFWDCLLDEDMEKIAPSSFKSAPHDIEHVGKPIGKHVSFLGMKTIPVDGYKIRNSLYLTQPLREPAQASVNVVMKEDIHRVQEESKYRGMEDQAAVFHDQVQTMLQVMGSQ